MHAARQQFLAGAALAEQQDRRVGDATRSTVRQTRSNSGSRVIKPDRTSGCCIACRRSFSCCSSCSR
jgi:hypothetical protein